MSIRFQVACFSFSHFLKIAKEIYLSQKFPENLLREHFDPLKIGPSFLLKIVTQTVAKFKRGTAQWLEFLVE